ncbi:MAG: ribonuclease HII [Patescibacteria group bacterium]
MQKKSFIIGIDEVGRGPLAGPVTVCGVIIPSKFDVRKMNGKNPLRDSKKMSQSQRESWFSFIKNEKNISYSLKSVSPRVIDRINVTRSANRAATRVLEELYKKVRFNKLRVYVYLDGGLHIEGGTLGALGIPLGHVKTVIKGDEKISAISLASIVAKVSRDAYMRRLHTEYPKYGFDIHKGYGTEKHRKAIRRYGPSKVHRLTFIRNFYTIKK